MTSDLTLPPKADTAAAPALLAQLQALQGSACRIDAQHCHGIGALCANILVSAHQSWHQDGLDFTISGATNLVADLKLLGLADLLLELEPVK